VSKGGPSNASVGSIHGRTGSEGDQRRGASLAAKNGEAARCGCEMRTVVAPPLPAEEEEEVSSSKQKTARCLGMFQLRRPFHTETSVET
jgi:hypothetical protein